MLWTTEKERRSNSKAHQHPFTENLFRQSARERAMATETKRKHTRDGWVTVAWEEQKPRLYRYNIYIHIFIYLFIHSLLYLACPEQLCEFTQRPQIYSSGGRKQEQKQEKEHHKSPGWTKPQIMCPYCLNTRFYCHGMCIFSQDVFSCLAEHSKYRKVRLCSRVFKPDVSQ